MPFQATFLFTTLIISLHSLCSATENMPIIKGGRPNIVIFLADDQSYFDHAINGNQAVPTPVTEAFSKEALVFDRAYTGQAICAPSRSILYSGLYPIRNGCFINHTSVRPGVQTIAHYLKTLDYDVILAGKSHVNPRDQFPWTEHMEPVRQSGMPRPAIPLEEMDRYIAQNKGKPFCMIVASEYPHGPYIRETPFSTQDIQLAPYLPGTVSNLNRATQYYASIRQKEREFASVLELIDEHGIRENTLVVYADDHGADMGKFTVSERGLRVAFMARWPGKVASGRTDALTSFVDFVPTAVELAGGTPPADLDGKSLIPILTGRASKNHDYVYGVSHNQGIQRRSVFPQRSISDGQYRYIFSFNSIDRLERDRAAGKAINYFVERGAKEHNAKEEQLYDINADPYELKDLSGDPKYAHVKGRLRSQLFAWMESQNDHLRENGPITLFAVKRGKLNVPAPQFNYQVPEKHRSPLGAALEDAHAITAQNK